MSADPDTTDLATTNAVALPPEGDYKVDFRRTSDEAIREDRLLRILKALEMIERVPQELTMTSISISDIN